MCCFSQPVETVSGTNIFARGTAGGRQLLVYGMTLAARGDLAMVLPIPVPPSSPDDAVRFIDLEGYPRFFDDMRSGFPMLFAFAAAGPSRERPAAVPKMLIVHDVGAFEASFVPTIADFERIDPRFRLPAQTWDALPGYRDFGFAVFKLKGLTRNAGAKTMHPMAFDFPRRDARALFFPTVHVHDGQVHATAKFDHSLFCQADDAIEARLATWERSSGPASTFMHGDSAGIVDGNAYCFRSFVVGDAPNRDTIVAPA